ncbi:MAG: ABC transporter permease [Cyclobacteriaceae bacterium]|nr:ABC transporter permease [Cyclobacteriaceae bacterium]
MKPEKPYPPQRALQFLRWFCREDYIEEIEGDLTEVFKKESENSPKWAKWKFAWSVVRYFRPEFMKSFKNHYQLNAYGMYKNYFTIAWRTFLRSKGYSMINILGLAIGLSACLLIALYVHHELSYDRFHEKANRIYRADIEIKFSDNHIDLAVANPLFGETAKTDFSQVEQTTRLRWYGSFLVKKGDVNIREGNIAWADSTLFDVFTLPMIHGNPKTALTEPNTIVITESVARKYFDSTDVVGQTLTINNTKSRKITGVIKDIPSNSHFRFTSFVPIIEDEYASEVTWAGSQSWNTYLLLSPGADAEALVPELNKMLDRHLEPELKNIINKTVDEFKSGGDYFKASLTKLEDIHLRSNKIGELYGGGNLQYIYIFSVIACFILMIAVINFMNLATARSASRAREVGVRKVLGSLRSNLIQQFITESSLTCVIAMLLSVAITFLSLPLFNELTGKVFEFNTLLSPSVITLLAALTIGVGLLAGSYPAFYLSAFQPVSVLKGSKTGHVKKSFFRNALVVFQFSASVLLIAGTLIVFMQMQYIREKDLGYNREQILILNNTGQLGKRIEPIKNSLSQTSGVENLTVTGYLPVNYYRNNNTLFTTPSLDIKSAISLQTWTIDENYLPTMDMKLMEGRNFVKGKTDSASIILNESAAKFLGHENILERKLYRLIDEETKTVTEYRIVGIVKDFNFSSLREQVKPLAFYYGSDQGALTIKLSTTDIPALLSTIENQWRSVASDLPFEYSFMDADFDNLYKGERQIGKLITIFASLSIFISCLGLFGLATYIAEQRTKEVGIRKVLGASVSRITALLSKDFVRLVLLAVVMATPLAYYFTYQWLQGFAYRIELPWWVFILSGVIALIIAIATVSFQAIKAAMANPVDSLRSE